MQIYKYRDDLSLHILSENIFFISSGIMNNLYQTIESRLDATIETINSINNFFPNSVKILCEATQITPQIILKLKKHVNYLILFPELFNLISSNRQVAEHTNSKIKNIGEKKMTIGISKIIKNSNLIFDNFIKISGRYRLMDNFNKEVLSTDKISVKVCEREDGNCIDTTFYCIPMNQFENYYNSVSNIESQDCDIEHSIYNFLQKDSFVNIPQFGLCGYVNYHNNHLHIM